MSKDRDCVDRQIHKTIAAALKAERDWLRSIDAPIKRLPKHIAQAIATHVLLQSMPTELRRAWAEQLDALKGNKVTQHDPQKGFSILDEVAQIASERDPDKPDGVTFGDWAAASQEARELSKGIEPLVSRLEDAYSEAVKERNWEQALLLYQQLVFPPGLWTGRGIYDDYVCNEREVGFITRAKEWIAEAEELLVLK